MVCKFLIERNQAFSQVKLTGIFISCEFFLAYDFCEQVFNCKKNLFNGKYDISILMIDLQIVIYV